MSYAVERLWNRAQQYLAAGQVDAARVSLESLVQRDPSHLEAQLFLGGIAWEGDRIRDATRHALDAAAHLPEDPMLICDVVSALQQAGETVAARQTMDHPILARTNEAAVLGRLAGFRSAYGEQAEALSLLDRAKAAGAGGAEFLFAHAMQLVFNGRIDEAEAELEACLKLPSPPPRATLELARLRKQTPEQNHLADFDRRAREAAPGSEARATIEFARYKELEDLGRYDEAWDALSRANAMMFALRPHDPAIPQRLFEGMVQLCTPEFLDPRGVVQEGPQPIFIIGMPRSGTTVLDRLLGNHREVSLAGELDDFAMQMRWATNHRSTLDDVVMERLPNVDFAELGRRYLAQTQWRANGKPWFTDKLPRNWMLAGPIHRSLPQAKILNLVRDPMDVCFSNYRVMFADAFAHIYDLGALAAHYRQYRTVLAHWHRAMPGAILDVPYADLVRDTESTMRRVLDFCGLEWDPACVELEKNRSAVATLSTAQVRQPVHARAFQEWRRYERQLEPLRAALGDLVDEDAQPVG